MSYLESWTFFSIPSALRSSYLSSLSQTLLTQIIHYLELFFLFLEIISVAVLNFWEDGAPENLIVCVFEHCLS